VQLAFTSLKAGLAFFVAGLSTERKRLKKEFEFARGDGQELPSGFCEETRNSLGDFTQEV
jgi:hypothetical protein